MVLFPYHTKLGVVLYHVLCILHLYTSTDVSAGKHLFSHAYMLNFSTIRLVTSAGFSKAPSSLTLTCLHVWFSSFNVVSMNRIILIGGCLDAVGNIQTVVVFTCSTVIMEVKPWV